MDELKKEIPHVIILVILVVILLVLLTKFQWIQCSQVPGNWCEIYCTKIIQQHSRVALIYSDSDPGIGDARGFENIVRRIRPLTYLEVYNVSDLSYGLLTGQNNVFSSVGVGDSGFLKGFDLVIVEHAKRVSLTQRLTIKKYLDSGGTLVLVGDALTETVLSDDDKAQIFAQVLSKYQGTTSSTPVKSNTPSPQKTPSTIVGSVTTLPGASPTDTNSIVINSDYYKNLIKQASQPGFGVLAPALGESFVKVEDSKSGFTFDRLARYHPIVRGLFDEFDLGVQKIGVVSENPSVVTKIASVKKTGDSKAYPAVLETRYSGKVIYVAFPLEQVINLDDPKLSKGSPTMIQNLFDYLTVC